MLQDVVQKQELLSNAEKAVHLYVLSKPEKIAQMTIRQIAEETYTTPNTIMRYSKKLGYQGFKDFKIHIAKDLKELHYEDFQIRKSEETIHTINKMKRLYEDVLENSLQLLSVMQMERIIKRIEAATSINFIAYDANKALADYARHYFFLMGKICNVYSDFDEQILYAMNAEPERQIVFIISRSANTRRLIHAARLLHKRKVFTIIMTNAYGGTAARYCTETIPILFHEQFDKFGDCIFYTSLKYVLDCLIGSYYAKNYALVMKNEKSYDCFYHKKV